MDSNSRLLNPEDGSNISTMNTFNTQSFCITISQAIRRHCLHTYKGFKWIHLLLHLWNLQNFQIHLSLSASEKNQSEKSTYDLAGFESKHKSNFNRKSKRNRLKGRVNSHLSNRLIEDLHEIHFLNSRKWYEQRNELRKISCARRKCRSDQGQGWRVFFFFFLTNAKKE